MHHDLIHCQRDLQPREFRRILDLKDDRLQQITDPHARLLVEIDVEGILFKVRKIGLDIAVGKQYDKILDGLLRLFAAGLMHRLGIDEDIVAVIQISVLAAKIRPHPSSDDVVDLEVLMPMLIGIAFLAGFGV